MALIAILDVLVLAALCASTLVRGFERTLPLAAFLLVIFPNESQIQIPGLFDLTTQRLLIAALLTLYLLFGGKREKKKVPLVYLVPLLVIWMLVSTAQSVVTWISFKTVLSEFFDFFILYFIFAKSISRTETIQKILFAFLVAMFLCSVFGFAEGNWGWSIIRIFPVSAHRFSSLAGLEDRGVRVQSSFGHPILFGATLAMAIPWALYLLTIAKSKGRRIFLWGAILLMAWNIYKTGSRGPWIALALSCAIMLLFAEGRVRKYLGVMAFLTVTVLVVRPGVWDSISNLFAETMDPTTAQGESYEWRYTLYHAGTEHLAHDPVRALWGYGPESFSYLGWQAVFEGRIVPIDSCDSSIAALMVETGYIGLAIVAALFFRVGWIAFQSYRTLEREASSLSLVLFVNICAFCFMMTNVMIYGWGQQNYILWILIAIAMVLPELSPLRGTEPAAAPSAAVLAPS